MQELAGGFPYPGLGAWLQGSLCEACGHTPTPPAPVTLWGPALWLPDLPPGLWGTAHRREGSGMVPALLGAICLHQQPHVADRLHTAWALGGGTTGPAAPHKEALSSERFSYFLAVCPGTSYSTSLRLHFLIYKWAAPLLLSHRVTVRFPDDNHHHSGCVCWGRVQAAGTDDSDVLCTKSCGEKENGGGRSGKNGHFG